MGSKTMGISVVPSVVGPCLGDGLSRDALALSGTKAFVVRSGRHREGERVCLICYILILKGVGPRWHTNHFPVRLLLGSFSLASVLLPRGILIPPDSSCRRSQGSHP